MEEKAGAEEILKPVCGSAREKSSIFSLEQRIWICKSLG